MNTVSRNGQDGPTTAAAAKHNSAIAEASYGNVYRGIYPIKVNQLHEVVDELLDAGRPYGMGLECGSKAELIACLPQIDGDTLLVCNGVKDRTMLSLMIAGQKLGQNIVPERCDPIVASLPHPLVHESLESMRIAMIDAARALPTHEEFIRRYCASGAAAP